MTGSHIGLIFNRKVYRAVAGALAFPELPADGDDGRDHAARRGVML